MNENRCECGADALECGCRYTHVKLGVLTAKQRDVLLFIAERVRHRGVAPTYREISQHIGCSYPNVAHQFVKAVVKKGYLAVQPNQSRAKTVLALP